MHTIYVSLLYFLCLFVFSLALTIDDNKHNMGIMVLQTHLPLTGVFKNKKQAFYDVVYTGVVHLTFSLFLAFNQITHNNSLLD